MRFPRLHHRLKAVLLLDNWEPKVLGEGKRNETKQFFFFRKICFYPSFCADDFAFFKRNKKKFDLLFASPEILFCILLFLRFSYSFSHSLPIFFFLLSLFHSLSPPPVGICSSSFLFLPASDFL